MAIPMQMVVIFVVREHIVDKKEKFGSGSVRIAAKFIEERENIYEKRRKIKYDF